MSEATLVRPRDLADAVASLAADPDLRPLGGGTAVVPRLAARDGLAAPGEGRWLAVDRIAELTEPPRIEDDALAFGAATTLRALELDPLVRRHAPMLASAVAAVAGPGVRNRATIGGSIGLGSASPDPTTALVALDARLVIARPGALAVVAPDERRASDLIVAITIPIPPLDPGPFAYRRFTMRGAADRPVVTLALAGPRERARVALGAAVPDVVRLRMTEHAIAAGSDAAAAAAAELDALPVRDDDRASSTYRRRLVAVLIGRAVADIWDVEPGEAPSATDRTDPS